HIRICARDQHAARAGLEHRADDLDHQLRRLSLPQDRLGSALAKLSMYVGAGEAKVAERQLREPVERHPRLDLAALHRFQQPLQIVSQAGHGAKGTDLESSTMVLGRALSWTAERYPDRPAVGGDRPLSYAQWDARTNQLARALAGLGVRRGDRVALVTTNGEPMATAHLGCQKLGAASVPLNVRYVPDELAYCLNDATPKAVLSDDSTAALVREALAWLESPLPPLVHDGEDAPAPGARGF